MGTVRQVVTARGATSVLPLCTSVVNSSRPRCGRGCPRRTHATPRVRRWARTGETGPFAPQRVTEVHRGFERNGGVECLRAARPRSPLCSATSPPLGVRPLCFLCVPLCISVVNSSRPLCGRGCPRRTHATPRVRRWARTGETGPLAPQRVTEVHRGIERNGGVECLRAARPGSPLCSATSSPLGVRPLCFLCVPLCISVVNSSRPRCGRGCPRRTHATPRVRRWARTGETGHYPQQRASEVHRVF